jgi:hypothetical protein
MVLGVDKSMELLLKLKDVEVYFVYSNAQGDYVVFFSEGMEKLIVKQD